MTGVMYYANLSLTLAINKIVPHKSKVLFLTETYTTRDSLWYFFCRGNLGKKGLKNEEEVYSLEKSLREK
jgi:hypothetical protein